MQTNFRRGVLGLAAAGLLAATALSANVLFTPTSPVHAEISQSAAPQAGFADLAEKVMPAVISVEVAFTNTAAADDDQTNQDQPSMPDLPDDSPFRDFFKNFPQFKNMPQQKPRDGVAQGSGFVISPDGYAVTNNHVVGNADKVTVRFASGDEFGAKIIGTDPKTDLALIKIETDKKLPYVKFAGKEPRVGDWVMAVGNPFGLGGSVTTGIISARGRDIGSGPYDDFLQIDASINRGNSGGPAFNLDGDVVGINTAIYSPSGGSVGIGFAIPASTAQDVIASLKDNGAVTRGWLGVQIQPVNDDLAESLGLSSKKGALVADVTEKSPAADAGLKTGDTIVKLGSDDVNDPRDLAKKVARHAPGKTIDLTIVRDGKTMNVPVAIGKMPGDDKVASKDTSQEPQHSDLAGLGLTLAPGADGGGVKVIAVKPDSAAEARGIKAGDVILEVAGAVVHTPADVKTALEGMKPGDKRVLMLVRSGEGQRFVALPVGQS
jgi:serine protease Do